MASQSSQVDLETLNFMKMKCEELAEALSTILDDNSYDKDLEKLKEENIDGKLFLTLLDNPDLLNDLKLSAGGKAKIKEVIQEIKDGSTKFGQSDSRKPNVLWCSTVTPQKPVVMLSGSGNGIAASDGGKQKAVIPPDAVWPWEDCKEFYVEFRNVGLLADWTFNDGQPMNTDTIIRYANTWNRMGGGKIPCFVEAKLGEKAQIRCSFNDEKIRKSELGKRAQTIPAKEPTMNLDLHTECPDDNYKKHLIIHEFGHALGLGHEHQRSDFWKCIKPHTDIEKMKEDLGMSDHEEQFANDWEEIAFSTSKKDPHMTKYDPDSIMHYWFRIEWLTNGYSDKKKIEEDQQSGYLSEKVARALLGVHKRHKTLAYEPSPLDIQLLQEVYGELELAPPDPKRPRLEGDHSAPGPGHHDIQPSDSSNRLNSDQHHAPLLDKLTKHATRWKDIGRNLGFTEGELDIIDKDRDLLLQGPRGYLDRLLKQWMEWFPGDRRGSTGYATLEGMKDALFQANLGATAHDLHL